MTLAEKLTAVAENQQAVYEAGKTNQQNEFWESFQQGGQRSDYQYAFRSWTAECFAPRYPIVGKLQQAFMNSDIQHITVPLVATGLFNSVFQAADVVSIASLDISQCTSASSPFHNCYGLQEIRFEGIIGVNGINLATSTLLSKESLLNILEHLEDKTGDTGGTQWILTIGSTNKAKLTADQLQVASNKGWTVK